MDYHSLNAMLNLYGPDGRLQLDADRAATRQYFLQHVNQNTVFFHDLEEKIDYYIAHPEQAQQIIDHANDFARQFYDSRRERFISLLVMKKYFEKTGQLPPTNR